MNSGIYPGDTEVSKFIRPDGLFRKLIGMDNRRWASKICFDFGRSMLLQGLQSGQCLTMIQYRCTVQKQYILILKFYKTFK